MPLTQEQTIGGKLSFSDGQVTIGDQVLPDCIDEYFDGKVVVMSVRELPPGDLEALKYFLGRGKRPVK